MRLSEKNIKKNNLKKFSLCIRLYISYFTNPRCSITAAFNTGDFHVLCALENIHSAQNLYFQFTSNHLMHVFMFDIFNYLKYTHHCLQPKRHNLLHPSYRI